MNKTKELAREVLSMMSDSQGVAGFHMNGDIASWGEYQELEELANAVLAEPEPELKGWICNELEEEWIQVRNILSIGRGKPKSKKGSWVQLDQEYFSHFPCPLEELMQKIARAG